MAFAVALAIAGCGDNSEATPPDAAVTDAMGRDTQLTGIAIDPAAPTLAANSTRTVRVLATYGDDTTRDVTSRVAWSSAAPAIATVDNSTLTGVAKGDTTITATFEGKYSSTHVFVTAALQSIAIAPATLAVLADQQLTATGTYSDGTTANVTASATWMSSDTAVATVSASGLASTLAVGTTTFTATINGITGSAAIDIVVPPVGAWAAVAGFAGAPCNDAVKLAAQSDYAYVCTKAGGVQRGAIAADSTITWSAPNTGITSLNGLAVAAHGTSISTMMYMSVPSGTDNNWFRSNDNAAAFTPYKLLDSAGNARFLFAGRFMPMLGNLIGTWDPNNGAPQAILLTGNNPPAAAHVIGNVTGSVRSIAASAPDNVYVAVLGESPAGATATGGVFRSTSAAATWTETDTGIAAADRDQIASIALDAATPATLYAGVRGGARLYKTTDAGATWTASATGLPAKARVAVVYVSPNSASTIYAATDRGLYVSTDAAAHWTLAGFQGRAVRGIAQSTVDATLVLVAVDDAVGLYRPQTP